MSADKIVYEKGDYWVHRVKDAHYEVYRNGLTHSYRASTVSSAGNDGAALVRAIAECDRRAAA